VESDLAVFEAVEKMKVETLLTPVGDKWLSARKELTEKLLIGEEASGHLVWPIEASAGERKETIVTGNGILTGLRGAAAVLRLGLKPAQAAEPYEPGVFKTFHAYFTDRSRFYRGSAVWQEDAKIVEAEVERLKGAGRLPAKCRLRAVDFDDDPDMLYLRLVSNGSMLGAVFARNSGTENKTATYARGLAAHGEALIGIARAMNENHMRTMKDARIPEARAGLAVAEAAREKGRLSVLEARKIAREHGIESDAAFVALLFALGREGRARRVGDEIVNQNQ
jgi:phosphomannomutase